MATGIDLKLKDACQNGRIDDVKRLIEMGANVNSKCCIRGSTPVHDAVMHGQVVVLRTLLSNGGDPDATDCTRWTPLRFAMECDNTDAVSTLLLQGANRDVGSAIEYLSKKFGETQLHSASRCGREELVKRFLDDDNRNNQRSFINERNSEGDTPLHIAVTCKFIDIAKILLKHGADWRLTDNKDLTVLQKAAIQWNETELHSAVRLDMDDAIPLLITNEDQVNHKSSKGYTALHLAAISGSRNTTLNLLKQGALLFETDSEGKTAMDIAQTNSNRDVSKLYKSILNSGLPKELLYLKTQDSTTFTSNLRSGFYLSFSGKIMMVGHQAVGKTAITTKLRGLKPRLKRHSTEGLDLHIYKAAIDMTTKKWICKELDIEDVAFRDLVSKPKILATTFENLAENKSDESTCTESNERDESILTDPSVQASSERRDNALLRLFTMQSMYSVYQWIQLKLCLRKASISTVTEIQDEAVRRVQNGLIDSSLAPISMMDFGGQTAFYSTHQTFLNYRGIYILVINGSKGFDEELDSEMFIPGLDGKPTSRKFTLFWVGSIESLSTGTSDSFPKILVVCTHKDKVPKDEVNEKVNTVFTEIEKMYEGTSTMKHLVLDHRIFLNALNPDDPEYDRLKDVLVELVCNQPTWGEKLPKAWIHLKMMINRSVEKGETIMTMEALREVNQENPVQVLSEEDLQLFLKMQHAQGEIIYFPLSGLREHIVISPSFLVDAFRSLVTDSMFATGHRGTTIKSMNRNGLLKHEDISIIWKGNKHFFQHKHFLLPLMEHLDIVAVPRNYDKNGTYVNPDFYFVPSLVKNTADTNYFQGCESRVLGLSFMFHNKILPPAIGYRLIASCVDMFEIKLYNDQILLLSGMVVLKVKRGLDIAVFLRPARVDVFLIHIHSRFHIARDTASGIAECLKDILRNIFENYKATSSEPKTKLGMPYTIAYPCFHCLSPCYSEDTEDWICDHSYNITKGNKEVWEMNQMLESCTAECEGLVGPDLNELPTELHLAKLAQLFNWHDLNRLAIRLGLSVTEIKIFQDDYGTNLMNVAFLCLRKWKLKTNGTVGDVITAIRDMDLDIHAACKMLRNRPLADLDVSITEPTDQLLDYIANEAITESLFLAIELGHGASLWLQMKDDRERIVKINRKLLADWKSAHPNRKDQMKDLAQALCNIGLNITTFLDSS